MAQIGFTEKQEHVYDRFQTLRRNYADKHGRMYAPGFLEVLMDAWEVLENCKQQVVAGNPVMVIAFDSPPTEPKIVDIGALTMQAIDLATSEFIDSLVDPVSLQAYADNAEANDPQHKTGWAGTDPDKFLHKEGFRGYDEPENKRVVIRSAAASGIYLEKAYSFDNLFDLTNNKEFAMVFDDKEQAKSFLRKCGRIVEEWILEPENEKNEQL
jgi:hypothetical protein